MACLARVDAQPAATLQTSFADSRNSVDLTFNDVPPVEPLIPPPADV